MAPEAPASDPQDRSRGTQLTLPEPFAAVALLVLGCACAGLLLAVERPVLPRELPDLTLPEADVRRAIEADARAAQKAPGTPRARALEELLLEHGRAELAASEDILTYRARRDALAAAYKALAAEVGEPKALALRSKAAVQLEKALALELPVAQAQALLGAFPNVLATEHVTRDGQLVAPAFVARTLFEARWNILCGLPPVHAFEPIEQRAYYGWQALHADRVPLASRVGALEAYAKLGGDDIDEALGMLLLRSGNAPEAAHVFESAYRATGSLRLRNAVLAAQVAAKPRE